MASTWGNSWLASWATSWEHSEVGEPAVIIYGGDDAPRKRRRKEPTYATLFREIESTIHTLLHPETVEDQLAAVDPADDLASERLRRQIDELVVLAQGQHALLQRAARLRAQLADFEAQRREAEQEEDDVLMLFG